MADGSRGSGVAHGRGQGFVMSDVTVDAGAVGSTAPPIPGAAASTGGSSIRAIVHRVPFTLSVLLVVLVLSLATRTLWDPIADRDWYVHVGSGLPALQAGRLHTLLLGPFFAAGPLYYAALLAGFALVVGFAEWRLGTGRTVVVTAGGQLVGVLGGAVLLWLFEQTDWPWARMLAGQTHVGFAAGIAAAVTVASATVPPPWRLRLRLGIWVWLLVAVLYLGRLADLEAFVAVAIAMPFSRKLAGRRAQSQRAQPTRREWRLLATAGLIVVLTIQLVALLFPSVGPIGDTKGVASTGWALVAVLVIGVLLINGLRKGRRVAWWFAVVLASLEPLLLLFVVFVVLFAPVFGWQYRLEDVPQFTTEALFWTALLAVLIIGRRAFRVPRRRRRRQLVRGRNSPDVAKQILRRNGSGSLSWMTTWPENSQLITADESAYLAFRKHAGVAIAIGDPVGPPGSGPRVLKEFVQFCDDASLVPCLFSVGGSTGRDAQRIGWQCVQVAEDNLIDLNGLEFKGKGWQDIRTALNRAHQGGDRVPAGHAGRGKVVRRAAAGRNFTGMVGRQRPSRDGFHPRRRQRSRRSGDPGRNGGRSVRPHPRRDILDAGVRRLGDDPRLDAGSDAAPGGRLPIRHGIPHRLVLPGVPGRRRRVRLAVRCAAGPLRRQSAGQPRRDPATRSQRRRSATGHARRLAGTGLRIPVPAWRSRASSTLGTNRCTWCTGTKPTYHGSESHSPRRTCRRPRSPGCSRWPAITEHCLEVNGRNLGCPMAVQRDGRRAQR